MSGQCAPLLWRTSRQGKGSVGIGGNWELGGHQSPFPAHRLYCTEVDRASWLNERLGLGIAAFQGLSNLALNGEWVPWGGTKQCHGAAPPLGPNSIPPPIGIVLGTIFVGGSLMAGDEHSPGDLMSFLVASQTVQRSGQGLAQCLSRHPGALQPAVGAALSLPLRTTGPWPTSPSSLGR